MRNRLRPKVLHDGDLVLAWKRPGQPERLRKYKLDDRWQRPCHLRDRVKDSTYYLVEELDESPIRRKFASDQLKKYFLRSKRAESEENSDGNDDGDNDDDDASVELFCSGQELDNVVGRY